MSDPGSGHTRILIVPSDEGQTREYVISRRLLTVLVGTAIILLVFMLLFVLSYVSMMKQVRELPDLKRRLLETNTQLATVEHLQAELSDMAEFQESLLTMMGVAPADSAGAAGEGLDRVAGAVMTPPPSQWPLRGYVTQEFKAADRRRGTQAHTGIDLTAPEGAPVLAAGPGRVLQAGWDEELGNFIEIHHGFRYVTIYGHCRELKVRLGDRVEAGQVIATMGGTGKVTAPHLHFEVLKDGEPIDPRLLLTGEPKDAAPQGGEIEH